MAERFTLLSELGRGGMGVVWKARDEETGQIVALKLLRAGYADDPDYVIRFERELELARRIHSVHVVEVLGYGVRHGIPYLALEFVDGPSLRERLKEHGPYDWQEARTLLGQIATGLADAHAAGVIHRDLKPSNVLMDPHGVAKLADFGIAHGLDMTRVTGASTLLGTPVYLPPEGPRDERSDLYSLGVMAYELLAGAPPFEGETYADVLIAHVRTAPNLEKLPAEAQSVVAWLLEKDPANRPPHARDLIAVLKGEKEAPALPSQTSPDPGLPVSPSRTAGQQKTRRRMAVVAFAVLLATAAAVAGSLTVRSGELSQATPTPSALAMAVAPSPSPVATPTPTIAPTPTASPVPTPPPAPHNEFQLTGPMTQPRAYQTATLLANGQVLLVGSWDGEKPSASAELYDPATGAFQPTGSMSTPRWNHTATLLQDGRVLIVGGSNGPNTLASAELYDPKTGKFSKTGSMHFPREEQMAALLPSGEVLIAGGHNSKYGYPIAELYNPKTGRFTLTGTESVERCLGTATTLLDGRVLLTGNGCVAPVGTTSELYNPTTGRFTGTGSLATPRFGQAAVRLQDGKVLVVGGDSGSNSLASAEVYDPKTGHFTATGTMADARWGHTATLLGDGRVLVVGGWGASDAPSTAEVYDPATQTFSSAVPLQAPREDHTATLLSDGRVLIAGGNDGSKTLSSSEIYWP